MTAQGRDFAEALHGWAPSDLVAGRRSTHQAAQMIADAARANLAPASDYSHMSLEWRTGAGGAHRFVSQALPGDLRMALALSPPALVLIAADGSEDPLPLRAGDKTASVRAALDAWLAAKGLQPASAVEPDQIENVDAAAPSAYAALDAWFALAATALTGIASAHQNIRPGPSPVRCWPHHFDIATYIALEEGDPEHAKGVGIGLSPGDEYEAQPYFYVNPWPAPKADQLPSAPAPGSWRTEGFIGYILTADAVLNGGLTSALDVQNRLDAAFNAAKRALDA